MSNEVLQQTQPIAAYDPFRAQLGELRQLNSSVVFNYEDPKGNKEARSHVFKLRKTKSAVEAARKAEKAEALDYGRRVDAEAKEIMGEIEDMIEVHAKPIAEIEEREQKRRDAHESAIAEIIEAGRYTLDRWMDLPLEAMQDRLDEIEHENVAEFEEYASQAGPAKDTTISQINEAIAKREKHEAEQAELARLRQEAKDREQRERDERLKKEAAREAEEKARHEREEAAQREANLKRQAEEKAQRERDEAARREEELKRAAEEQREDTARREAELKRQAEEAERRAAEAEERAAREAERKAQEEKEEAERRERNKRHKGKINREAAAGFMSAGFTDAQAKKAVTLISKGSIEHVAIQY